MNFNNCNGYNLIGLASSFSIFISQGLSTDEISLLSGLFSAIGDNLAIIASTPPNNNKNNNSN